MQCHHAPAAQPNRYRFLFPPPPHPPPGPPDPPAAPLPLKSQQSHHRRLAIHIPVSCLPPPTATFLTAFEIQVVEGEPMDSAVAGGHIDEGRSNTDLIGHSGDIDSDSDQTWKSWVKSQFWYELPMSDDVPDYRELPYPWEAEEKEKASGSGKEEEEEDAFFLKVTDISWLGLSAEERKRGRWESQEEELTDVMQPDLSDEQRKDASLSLVGDLYQHRGAGCWNGDAWVL